MDAKDFRITADSLVWKFRLVPDSQGGVITQASDELHLRAGLPAEFRYLEPSLPRQDWPALRLHPTARHWLEVHGWFRARFRDLVERGSEWREGGLAAPDYRALAIPRLREVLSSLHDHHRRESELYFPALATREPGMVKGFALLDRDHDAIEHLVATMAEAATALNRAGAQAGDLGTRSAAALVDAIERGGILIERHLTDEEDIIVPVLTLRGDPFQR